MPRSLEDFAVFAAPIVFVLLWSSGFVVAKLGLAYAEPLTYLSVRLIAVVALLAVIVAATRPLSRRRVRLDRARAVGRAGRADR